MNNLEKLVPSLELCKQIPVGKFEASALVLIFWHKSPNTPVEIRLRCEVENDPEFDDLVEDQRIIIYPAPTLTEILDALYKAANGRCAYVDCVISQLGWSVETTYEVGEGDDDASSDLTNPATAALQLWLEVVAEK